jgi:hypothetical protein
MARGTLLADLKVNLLFKVKLYSTDKVRAMRYFGQ